MSNNLPFPQSEKSAALSCVKDLIGPKLTAGGIVCECPKCRVERGEPEEESTQPLAVSPQQTPQDAKMCAANDDTEQENSTEEADRIYLDQIRRRT